jgi:hypothetical protein
LRRARAADFQDAAYKADQEQDNRRCNRTPRIKPGGGAAEREYEENHHHKGDGGCPEHERTTLAPEVLTFRRRILLSHNGPFSKDTAFFATR